jgi:hypothetical protein
MNSSDSEWSQLVDCSYYGNKNNSIRAVKLLEQLSDSHILKKEFSTRSYLITEMS